MAATAILPEAPAELWSDLEIEVIGGTGEFSSGKTLFGLTIDPGPRTICWDNEGSVTTYAPIGFKRVDMAAELRKKFGKRDYRPLDRFALWLESVRSCEPGQYTVGMVDPISEIEAGLAQYVQENPTKFGYTAKQFEGSAALFWGAVKDYWKQILDDLRTRFKTFYFTTHMRDEFKGGRPTGNREPKGKETLWELASLFLEFRRDANSEIPSANVLKTRVAKTSFEGGKLLIVPCLPPRLAEATPAAIREYIDNPPDYNHLAARERLEPESLTEDERLRLRAYVAEKEAEAANANASAEEKRAKAAAAQREAAAKAAPTVDQSAQHANGKREATKQRAEQAPADAPITDAHKQQIIALREGLGMDGETFKGVLAKASGGKAEKTSQLTDLQAMLVIGDLMARQGNANGAGHGQTSGQANGRQAETPAPTAPQAVNGHQASNEPTPFDTDAERAEKGLPVKHVGEAAAEAVAKQAADQQPADEPELSTAPGSVTADQRKHIKQLAFALGWPHTGPDSQTEWLAKKKASTWHNVSQADADKLIGKLNAKLPDGHELKVPF